MEYRTLGKGLFKISVIGLGFWQAGSKMWGFPENRAREHVFRAVASSLEHGINFFDTAEIYGGGASERLLGEAIRAVGAKESVIVASKVAGFRWTPRSIEKGVQKINQRLGFRVDLIQHHWPPPAYVPICNVVRGLERVVKRGMAHSYGLSNYHARLLEKALYCSKGIEPVSNQVQYSLAYRVPEKTLIPLMRKTGITLIAWSPLAKGALAGARLATSRAQKGDPVFKIASRDETLNKTLQRLSEAHRASKAQIALSWLIAKGAVPIPGARRPERVAEYAGSVKVKLSINDIALLDSVTSKYVDYWGKDYTFTPLLRVVPGFLVRLLLILGGGI